VRNHPLIYPEGQTAPHHTAAPVDYYLMGNNGQWEARCAHGGCGFRVREDDKRTAEGRIENHVRCHKSASKIAASDDIQKIKDAINHCDAYDSVSMWLDPQGNISVVAWHGGESAIYSKFDQGYVRLHWDPRTFIVHFKSALTPAQGVALFTLLEAIHMPNVTVQSPGGGVHVDTSRNPSSQMKLIRNALLKQATPSPQDIKAACWSKGFFELMAKEFGARGNDPVHGACRLVMEALKIIFPSGEKMATVLDRGDSPDAVEFFKTHQPIVQHYVLKIGNMYLDGNGAHTAQDITTDEELGGWREIPNLIIPATQQLIDSNRGISCPPGAAQRAAQYILDYKG
jgi:hypothetical protein